MRGLINTPLYFRDRLKYKHLNNILFWWKKSNWFLKGHNFGDYLSMIIVGEIIKQMNLSPNKNFKNNKKRLLALGSILHFAKNNDVIWGSGINGTIDKSRYEFTKLDVRMVRGPKTKQFLQERGITVKNNVFGDPGLLLPILFPTWKKCPKKNKIIFIPHYNDIHLYKKTPKNIKLVSPLKYWKKITFEILSSELVLSSSLHGIIIAEAFKVPVHFLKPGGSENLFKYQDYYLGTGRKINYKPTPLFGSITPESGISMPKAEFDTTSMLKSFPKDLFL
jgi:pyruvyltransferase